MTFDPTKPVEYHRHDGVVRSARIIATDAKGERPIIALVTDDMDVEHTMSFTADGVVPNWGCRVTACGC